MKTLSPYDRAKRIPLPIIISFHKSLLAWFEKNQRHFPWRETNDPFKILISELLLQKTNCRTVSQVYKQFLFEFPSAKHVIQKSSADIYEIVSELGLFYRAERIFNICNSIENEFNGLVPNTQKELMTLTGVGRYASSAVLCFGFNQRRAILDQNVIRILSRVFSIVSIKPRPRNDNDLWLAAEHLLPEIKFKEYNYALLDFSAIICKTRPLCCVCPINNLCEYQGLL